MIRTPQRARYFLLLGTGMLALALTSCYPGGATDNSDRDVAITGYDLEYDFSVNRTYARPGEVQKICDEGEDCDPLTASMQALILQTVDDNMSALGYTMVDDTPTANPDVRLPISVIESTTWYLWASYPPYWWGPGWGCCWYPWYPWYPSYGASSVTTGTVQIDFVPRPQVGWPDPDGDGDGVRVSVAWSGAINGVLGSVVPAEDRVTQGINQVFEQSPYLGVNIPTKPSPAGAVWGDN